MVRPGRLRVQVAQGIGDGEEHHRAQDRGVGAWTDAELRRALTEGVDRTGKPFATQMQRQIYFAKMTPQDLDAVVAWVRTIPAAE